MLRKLILLGMACALAVAIAGCGSKEPESTSTTEPAVGKSSEAPKTDAKTDTKAPEEGKEPEAAAPTKADAKTTDAKATDAKTTGANAKEPFVPKPASGDATKFKGTYAMSLSPKQVELNKKMEAKGKAPFVGEITIDGAGNYEFKFGPKGKERVTKGTTQASGSDITLSPVTIDGRTPEADGEKRQIPATLQPDGKTLVLHLKSKAGGGDMKFIKK